MQSIIESLKKVFPSTRLLLDADSLQFYGKDWTTIYSPNPTAIVFPQTTLEVQQIIHLANEYKVALVPSAGRTGYSGGAVAMQNEIVVSCERMNQIVGFDPIDRTVQCEAGVVTGQLQAFAREKNLLYPVDFASSGASRIGGNIGTNAGGLKVFRYGSTRHWVSGLTVVTGQGEILELNKGLIKNATGYDLMQLFIGSEGTLGIVTAATMRLTRLPESVMVMLLAVKDFTTILSVLKIFQDSFDLTAFEFFSEPALQKVLQKYNLIRPVSQAADFYVVIEFENPDNIFEEKMMKVFQTCLEKKWVLDGVISENLEQIQQLWRYREAISEAIYEYKPHKYDLAILVSKMPDFIRDIEKLLKQVCPGLEVVWFGHIGDGNLHLNLLKPVTMEVMQFHQLCQPLDKKVFELIHQYEGAISAEHGIGLLKKEYLSNSRAPAEIALMRNIKKTFDPNNILNPGKIF